jgi:hypothetical protein
VVASRWDIAVHSHKHEQRQSDPINLPAGLEDNLIEQLKPLWNKLGNG